MRHTKGTIAFILIFTMGMLFSLVAFGARNKNIQIDSMGRWDFIPSIRVCKVAPVSVHEVATAAKWWQDLGYEFDLIYSEDCARTRKFGTITITLDQGQLFMNNLLGRTTFYADSETGSIAWTIIELRSPYTDRVLEHEIGHALGWMHARVRGHMMHPNHFDGGWNGSGLELETEDD